MDIIWHGNSCFTIKTKTATAVINPYKDGKGLKLPKLKGNIAIVTNGQEGNDNVEAIEGDPKVIDWPGEYEISGMVLTGKKPENGKGFFFTLVGDSTRVCYIEDVGKELNDELIEGIGDVDILIVPVGGTNGLGPERAHKITEEVEPRCIIPMHYAVDGSTGELQTADAFLKLSGSTPAEPQEKFTIASRGALREDQTECVLLMPQVG